MLSETIELTSSFLINRPVDIVFPLQSPEGEKLWVPNWDYNNIMGNTNLKEDYVFTTKNHDHAAADAIWIVNKFDADNHFVQFYKIEPNQKIGVVTIECRPFDGEQTKVSITYKYIGLSAEGNEFIKNFTEEEYELFIAEWQRLLEEYFEKS